VKKEKQAGEISPAFEHNKGFKRAAKKMPALGNETVFPRNDNAFMAKESLSYDDSNSKIWLDRPKKIYESQLEWFTYLILGVLIGICAFTMDIIEESLVHFKDHYT